jgi:hypothetical protein
VSGKSIAVVGAVCALVLAGCGRAAATLTPLQSVHAAAAKTVALSSYKMDFKMAMSGKISLASTQCGADGELPPAIASAISSSSQGKPISPAVKAQMCAQLAQQASKPAQAYSMKMDGTGSYRTPSDFAGTMNMDINSGSASAVNTTITVKMVHVNGATYVTNPLTGAWTTLDKFGAGLDPATFDNLDAGAYSALLDAAKSVKDLGDTTLSGTRVHHYLVTVDPDYLVQQSLKKPVFKDPAMQQLITQYAESFRNTSTAVETWVGIDDQLIRREIFDITTNAGAAGAAAPITDLKEHFEVNLHDFNSKVDITAPKLG